MKKKMPGNTKTDCILNLMKPLCKGEAIASKPKIDELSQSLLLFNIV